LGSDGSIGSFACQGVDYTANYSPPSPVQVQYSGGESSREPPLCATVVKDKDPIPAHEGLHPEPLFSGSRGGANDKNGEDEARRRTQLRNTRFYQPYGEILEQYSGDQSDENNRL
jgi:hypothetical protein